MNLRNKHLKIVCLLALTAFSLNVHAQNLQNLDQTEGVSIFKFGMDTSQIREMELKPNNHSDLKNIGYFNYTGDALKTYFNIPVDQVLLYFYQNQLFRIDVNFGTSKKEYTLEQYNHIQQQLEKAYGKENKKLAMSGAVLLGGFAWYGEKAQVSHTRHSYPTKHKKDNTIYGGVTFSHVSL